MGGDRGEAELAVMVTVGVRVATYSKHVALSSKTLARRDDSY